ncbi:TIGR02117 family protein [Sphingomonas sp. RS2018]
MIRYRVLVRLIGVLLAIPVTYALSGIVGGLIPTNASRVPPPAGIRIYVEDNGIHTGIVLPAAGWDDIVRPDHFRDPRYAGHGWRSFSWGDRAFYIGTPTWSDVSPLTVLRAATGSDDMVMHVEAVPEPRPGGSVRAVTLRPEEYARLVDGIRASFEPGAPVQGYFSYDAFYPARGRYSALHTCNGWTGDRLRNAGLKMGWFTPFPWTVMRWL